MRSEKEHNQPAKTSNKTQAEIKAEKRAAALRDNLKKRKALAKEKKKDE
jgi:hypothetical protein